jgi:hypothetical protein
MTLMTSNPKLRIDAHLRQAARFYDLNERFRLFFEVVLDHSTAIGQTEAHIRSLSVFTAWTGVLPTHALRVLKGMLGARLLLRADTAAGVYVVNPDEETWDIPRRNINPRLHQFVMHKLLSDDDNLTTAMAAVAEETALNRIGLGDILAVTEKVTPVDHDPVTRTVTKKVTPAANDAENRVQALEEHRPVMTKKVMPNVNAGSSTPTAHSTFNVQRACAGETRADQAVATTGRPVSSDQFREIIGRVYQIIEPGQESYGNFWMSRLRSHPRAPRALTAAIDDFVYREKTGTLKIKTTKCQTLIDMFKRCYVEITGQPFPRGQRRPIADRHPPQRVPQSAALPVTSTADHESCLT